MEIFSKFFPNEKVQFIAKIIAVWRYQYGAGTFLTAWRYIGT
jgi:hypothetical protein